MKPKKYYTKEDALARLQKYCAYQDRCHQEVRYKLLQSGIYGQDLEDIIVELIQDNFLNEERFARSYARGKFRIKHWGKRKIIARLKQQNISSYCIKKGMEEIDEEEYRQALSLLLQKKNRHLEKMPAWKQRQKLFLFALNKGYESEIINESIKNLHHTK